MKKLIFVFLLLFVSSSVWAVDEFSFRGSTWGMTHEDVSKIEPGALLPEKSEPERGYYMYALAKPVFGFDGVVLYDFSKKNGGLEFCGYRLNIVKPENSTYWDVYLAIQAKLIATYGEELYTMQRWADESQKDNYERTEDALLAKNLGYETVWRIGDCEIFLAISKKLDDKMILFLNYTFFDWAYYNKIVEENKKT